MSNHQIQPETARHTLAEFWLWFVSKAEHGHTISQSKFARGILEQTSDTVCRVGFAGFCWSFRDGSKLIAHPGNGAITVNPGVRA